MGAVRHNGFIPWDDDIDVGLPRKDYEKLLEVAQSEVPSHIFLQTSDTDKYYHNNFAKFRNSNTTFIETPVRDFNINHGVYIDIFPLDGYNKSKHINKMIGFYGKKIRVSFNQPKPTTFKSKIKYMINKILFGNYRKMRDNQRKLLSKCDYDENDIVINYTGAWGSKEIMEREIFGNGSKASFEGIDVVIPEKYDLYLSKLYGDYMTLPPEEKRVSWHYCEKIDLTKSYKEYIKVR